MALSGDLVAQMESPPLNRDYRLYTVDAFYSELLDSCIHVEVKLIGPEVFVRDLTRTVIRNDIAIYPPVLLHCDAYGIDEANIEAVRRYKGNLKSVPYTEWLTDGQGGLPRALRSLDIPLDRADCESALARWLEQWGPKG